MYLPMYSYAVTYFTVCCELGTLLLPTGSQLATYSEKYENQLLLFLVKGTLLLMLSKISTYTYIVSIIKLLVSAVWLAIIAKYVSYYI